MNGRKFHVHIDFNSATDSVFQFSQKQIDDLLGKNPEIAECAEFTLAAYENDRIRDWPAEEFERFYRNAEEADAIVGFRFPTDELAKRAKRLRWIHSISSGIEHLAPFDWLPAGVKIINNRGVHIRKSGESFAMYLRMLSARVPLLLTAQRKSTWERVFTTAIKEKTLVIFGVGNQGGEMARVAKNTGLRVIGVDPYRKECEHCETIVPIECMKDVFGKADFLAITAPETPETIKIIDAEKMSWLPKGAGLINVSRGALLDEDALDAKLRECHLSGAILDVFSSEPLPPDSPLWKTPNLLITPHVSSDDLINYIPLTLELVAKNIQNDIAGRPLVNVVDVSKGF